MFTGIVDSLGKFTGGRGSRFTFSLPDSYGDKLDIGDSVAVNGVCLTLVEIDKKNGSFSVDVSRETRSRTNVGSLRPGEMVNMELPLSAGEIDGRLDGHLVQGHVDTMGRVTKLERKRDDYLLRLVTEKKFSKFLVDKGAIAVDGISLTPFQVAGGSFAVSVIPHTYNNTTLQYSRAGRKVNLEFDILAKYVQKSVSAH